MNDNGCAVLRHGDRKDCFAASQAESGLLLRQTPLPDAFPQNKTFYMYTCYEQSNSAKPMTQVVQNLRHAISGSYNLYAKLMQLS